ncbi:MAG: carboxypeptidase-like regulatory domain-containing protein, partial [Parafilimonas sp.]
MRNFKHLTKLLAAICFILFLMNAETASAQQNKSITGTITSQSGAPLSGVSVTIKGTTNGVVSNEKGEFIISVPANATLAFTHVGYKLQEITVRNQTA